MKKTTAVKRSLNLKAKYLQNGMMVLTMMMVDMVHDGYDGDDDDADKE